MRYFAELLGTFLLVLAGCGAIVADQLTSGGLGVTGIGFVFGAVVAVVVFTIGPVSGAHINPAVTLMLVLARKITPPDGAGYILSQLLGALIAAWSLLILFPGVTDPGITRPITVGDERLWMAALVLEVVMSFLLALVILRAIEGDPPKLHPAAAALFIGTTVGLEAIFGGPVSGASMNPARSIGPAVAGSDLSFLWIYIVGPVAGMLLALTVGRVALGLNAGSKRSSR